MTTTPSNTDPPARSPMPAIDIQTVVIQAAAAMAGAQALISPFTRTDSAIAAAATLLHTTVGELQSLASEIMEGSEA